MLKYAVAGALLLSSLATSGPAAVAAPREDDAGSKPYNTESPARIRQEMDRGRASDASFPIADETARGSERASPARPERAGHTSDRECADCPPPKHYDNVEVVKTSRDVDRSRVINTESVVEAPPRTKETNKLVIHENETRNVGVIQHNHKIIEKHIRYVKRAPVYRYRAPAHRVVRQVQTVLVPVVVPAAPPCGCPCSCSGSGHAHGQAYAYGQAYVYGGQAQGYGGYAYASDGRAVQHVLVPVQALNAYGYR